MATFGDTIIAIVWEIISSIIGTSLKLILLIFQLFQIVFANFGQLSALHIMIIVLILGTVVLGVFKLLKGDVKNLVVAFVILAILLLISLVFL